MRSIMLLLILAFAAIPVAHTDDSALGKFSTTEIEYSDLRDFDRQGRQIPMKIHLPIDTDENALPVVILSHGAGGNLNANFAQAKHLASHGYIVVCLEHVGSNSKRAREGGLRIGKTLRDVTHDADEVLSRPKDVSFAIDQLVRWNKSNEQLRGKVDIDRVGVMGHSFGAYTTLTVCGARPALDWLQPKVRTGTGLGPDLFDQRVKCGVALSPQGPGEPFFLKESYASIRVPLLGISGTRDKQQNFKPIHRKQGFQYWPEGERYFLWLANANHLSFSDSTGSKLRRDNRVTRLFSDRREDVQRISRAATLRFFDKYLNRTENLSFKKEDLQSYAGGIVDDFELLTK